MVQIIYKGTTIYINIDLLKSRIKKGFMWILKVSQTTAVIAGIFLLLGTVGASDLENITFSQMLYQVFISVLLFVGAYIVEVIKVITK